MKLNKKNKIALAGIIFALYLCYTFAISNTFNYYSQYKFNKSTLGNNFNDSAVSKELLSREKQLNDILGQYTDNEMNSFQNELLKKLTDLSHKNNLKIIDFRQPHIITDNDIITSSYIFGLEGSFNSMLLLLNDIENTPSLGFIKHLEFTKKKNYKTNTDYLITQVILQKKESKKNY